MVLSVKNKKRTVSVHRMVAEAFLPKHDNSESVNHKDFDKKNNHVENLEWLSISLNVQHACKNGRHYRKPVQQISKSGELIKEWESAYAVEKQLGFHSTLISRCCRGRQKSYKHFIWRFKNAS